MTPRARLGILVGLLLASETLYVALARSNAINGVRPVLTFLVVMTGLFLLATASFLLVRAGPDEGRVVWWLVAGGAVLFRLTLLPAGLPHDARLAELLAHLRADLRGERVAYERFLLYDTDLWRYLWDGHAWAHGVNPFVYPPIAEAVDRLADPDDPITSDGRYVWPDIRDNINHPDVPTIYPPLAQVAFRAAHAIAPGSVLAWKGLLVVVDLVAGLLVALTLEALGRSRAWAILYLWNPLVVKAFAGSGHLDALAAAALAAVAYCVVKRRNRWAAASLALAVLAKLAPIVLAPLVGRRIGWRPMLLAGVLVAAGYAPFVGAGVGLFAGFKTFATQWQFNPGPYLLAERLAGLFVSDPQLGARALCGLAFLGFVVLLWRRDDGQAESLPEYGAWLLGVLLVLGPVVMPWYVTWVLPFAVVARQRVWVFFSALVCLAFLVMVDGIEREWVLGMEYGVFAALLLLERRRQLRGRSSSPFGTRAALSG